MRLPLKKKVSIAVMTIVIVFTAISAIAVYFYAKNLLLENIETEIASIAHAQSREVMQILSEGHRVTDALSNESLIKDYLQEKEPDLQDEDVLRELESFNLGDHYAAIYVMDIEGKTLASTSPSFVGNNYGFRDYFQHAKLGMKWTDVSRGVTSKQIGYYFSSPVSSDEGDVIGVLVAKMQPKVVHNALPFTKHSNKTTIMFVDNYGVVLYSNNPNKILHSLSELKISHKREMTNSRRFEGLVIPSLGYGYIYDSLSTIQNVRVFRFFDKYDGERKILSIAKVGEFPFFVITEQEEEFYTDQILGVVILIVGLFISGGMASLIAIRMILTHVFKPLESLQRIVSLITKGNYHHRVHISTGDELEDFGDGFNKMIETLARTKRNINRKIRNQTGDLLEQKKDLEFKQVVMKGILKEMETERNKNAALAEDLKKFLLAIETATDHVVITDPDGIIVYANPAVETITGYKIKEIMGKKVGTKDNWGGQMPHQFYVQLWDTLKNKKKPFSGEVQQVRKGGFPYTVMAHLSPVLNKNNEVTFLVGIERDITKEKQIDKAKTEFVSLASHQLRTPLSSINWYTEMLLAEDVGKLNKDQKEYLGLVYEGNQRMVALVNSLLNVSRIDLGTFAIDPEEVDLPELADSVLAELVPDIKTKKLAIKTDYDKKLKLFKADPKLMRIIFQNLLTNSVKYTPEKGTITISIKKKNTKTLQIDVADTGYGIPKSQQSKIFTKLFRADNVRAKDSEGSGLGMYLVKAIVEEEAKGKISFKSQENKGTTFTILLPLSGMKKKEGSKAIT